MIPARFMCVVFLVIYGVYAFSHDPIALSAVFPVIIALTIYLNDVIINCYIPLSNMERKACKLMYQYHLNQIDKSGAPYYMHPLSYLPINYF